MFAVLFGLSMDYEVFLLSRVRAEYVRTGDNRRAVADGLANTARVITAAAAIMVTVFGAFVMEDAVFLKLAGIGMATAVFVDATVVRMVLFRRRWSCSATATGGYPAGSTGYCPVSTSKATSFRPHPI